MCTTSMDPDPKPHVHTRWTRKGRPIWTLLAPDKPGPPPKISVYWGSDPRSHPSPALPEHPPSPPTYKLCPKDAGVCFHPTLLPPAPCGGVPGSHITVKLRSKPWFDRGLTLFWGGHTPGHTPPQPSLNTPLARQHTSCVQRTQEYVFTQLSSLRRPVEESRVPTSRSNHGPTHGLTVV